MAAASLVSHLGEYARLVDHRTGRSGCVLARRPIRFPNGRSGTEALEPTGSHSAIARISAEHLHSADHSVWHRAVHLSVSGGVFTATQRCQYSRVAADALQSSRREIIPGDIAGLHRRADHVPLRVAL